MTDQKYDVLETHRLSDGCAEWVFKNCPVGYAAQIRVMDDMLIPDLEQEIALLKMIAASMDDVIEGERGQDFEVMEKRANRFGGEYKSKYGEPPSKYFRELYPI